MTNLEVVFPNPDNGHPTEPHIDKEVQVAHPDERINWNFFSVDNSIKYVEIEFDKAKFFPGEPDPKKFIRMVDPTGQAIIYGTVPASSSIKEDKYTIRGYASDPTGGSAEALSKLDPKIVTAA